MIARFDEIFERCGQCKVGVCDVENEPQLFDLLLTAEPGLYINTKDGLGCSRSMKFNVQIVPGSSPVCHDLWRMSKVNYDFVDKEIKKMIELGVIEKYMGPWQSAVVVVPKPGVGQQLRFCVDLRDVNNISDSIVYPLPIIDEII